MMQIQIAFKSSAHERYNTEMNDRVRLHIEQAGVKVVSESGGSQLGPLDDPVGADNGFGVRCDEATAQRLSEEISILLGGRPVYVDQIKEGA